MIFNYLHNISLLISHNILSFDCYFVTDNVFNVCDIRIIVSNNMLAEAINKLPCDLRDIVLLSYFANMPDIEIAKQLDLSYWIVFTRIKTIKGNYQYGGH